MEWNLMSNAAAKLLRVGVVVVVAAGTATMVTPGSAGAAADSGGPMMSVANGAIDLAVATTDARRTTLEVSTTAARRGSAPLDLTVTGTSSPEPATVITSRTDMVETAQRVAGGAEQSWLFGQAPRGSGDLVLRVQVRAQTSTRGTVSPRSATDVQTGTTDDGVFVRYPGVVQAVYHNGTWIDSSGRQWPVTARIVEGTVELTVPEGVLAASTFPATLDPKIIVTPIING
jgi:hypothetical protein